MRTNFKTKTKPNMGRNRLHLCVFVCVFVCVCVNTHAHQFVCVCELKGVQAQTLGHLSAAPIGWWVVAGLHSGQTETIGFYGWARKQVGFIISLPVPGMKRGKSAGFALQSRHCPKTRQKINPMMAEQPFRLLRD